MARGRVVHVIVPEGIDDPMEPSGGNAYDRRVCTGLASAGATVYEHPVDGTWPIPSPASRSALHRTLSGIPDEGVVLVDGLVACGVPEVVVPHARRLRLVVLLHLPLGDELGRPSSLASSLAAGERETLRAASAVVATSGWAARRVTSLHGLAPERVHVATPGVEPAPPATGTDGVSRLLCVGALTPTKGQDLLVDALAALADRSWSCDLVGPLHRSPTYVAGIRAAINRHGLAERVRLAGPLPTDRLATVYAAADLLVLPSRAETYGMVLTEALARGLPVLASAVGGIPGTLGATPGSISPLIPPAEPTPTAISPLIRPAGVGAGVGANDGGGREADAGGLLVAADDADALAAGLRRWFDEPELRVALRRSALRRRDELTGWEVTSRCLAHVLDGLSGP